MDPYAILGLAPGAGADEIKQAYRREAMKWHPDRGDGSAEAKERFHQAALAYKLLRGRGNGDGAGRSRARDEQSAAAGRAERDRHSGEQSDDSVFWDVMLDYAIRLAQTGLGENAIRAQLDKNGCPARLASVIAEKAYDIHLHYANGSRGRKSGKRHRADAPGFKQERLHGELLRAFIGGGNVLFSPRGTLDYYLAVFAGLRKSANLNPLTWISFNQRLMRILNFSIILFAVLALAVSFFPGPSKYKLLPDVGLLQLPLGLLSLMFVWSLYRKLWLFTLVLGSLYLVTMYLFNIAMPRALHRDLASMLAIAGTCFAPFVFIALFGNYFYFRKAQSMIRSAEALFDNQLDRAVWIKNRAGTSSMAAFLFVVVFFSSLVYYAPRSELMAEAFSFTAPAVVRKDDEAAAKLKLRLEEAGRYFEIAEKLHRRMPPDYARAETAYSNAANGGSVLAAYKLAYLYYNGEGVRQNDVLALRYFERAVEAPLAFQPHSLELVTAYLGEAYNGLGVMYQRGLGTRQNLPKAREMFNRGAEFGSANARRNLETLFRKRDAGGREPLAEPVYD